MIYERREFPRHLSSAVSIEEQVAAGRVFGLLSDLSRFAVRFWHALQLFDSAEQAFFQEDRSPVRGVPADLGTYQAWMLIAARDASLTIFHFSKTLTALKLAVGQCAPLAASTDHAGFRDARRLFRDSFPNYALVRHAVAHAGEVRSTPKQRDRHAVSGPVNTGSIYSENAASLSIQDALSKRTYTNTYEGRVVSMDISMETLGRLDAVLAALQVAFAPADPLPARPSP